MAGALATREARGLCAGDRSRTRSRYVIAQFFIERPVMANVIAILMLVLGAVALDVLPVAQYPQLTPPTIQVTTSFPGAGAKAVQQQVARAIEQQVNGVEGMLYMQSYASNDGNYSLTVSFAVGTDPDQAQVAVQNRVNIALPTLPTAVQQQGVSTKKKSTAILQIITITSSAAAHDALFLSNYASLQVRDRLARLPGVADVNVFGIGEYSMRVWLDTAQMAQRGLDPADVINVINQRNQTISAGQIGMPPAPKGQQQQLTLTVDSPLSDAAEFGNLIVKSAADGSITRLRDVARLELGSVNYNQDFHFDNKAAGGITIYQLPDANALDTAKAVRAELERMKVSFPAGVRYDIPFDTTVFVKASIREIYQTLLEAGVLVLIVILMFLQSWRAAMVPATTVPVTIVGAFAAMALLGFTINFLTLFALVLCIGIVVDDAIVVVEGVAQKIDAGKPAKQAAIDAMHELIGPIIGITLVLTAVFIPAAFISGITGQMYRQFALVIAATAVLSGINAITLKPTQSAQYLRPLDPNRRPNRFSSMFNRRFEQVETRYLQMIRTLLDHRVLCTVAALALMLAAGYGFLRIPSEFLPAEDQGYVMIAVQLPDAASLERTQRALKQVVDASLKVPGVAHAISFGGVSPLDGDSMLSSNATLSNGGLVYVTLKDWHDRGADADLKTIRARLSAEVARIGEANARVLVPPPINGLGISSGFQMQVLLVDGSNDFQKMGAVTDALVKAAAADPKIQFAFTSLRARVPQVQLLVNRARAESVGVSVGDAYSAIQSYLGSSYVNLFSKYGQNFTVYVQADPKFRADVTQIGNLTVQNRSGATVPISAFVEIADANGPAIAAQYNLAPTAAIIGAPAAGYSSGQALDAMEALAARMLPAGFSYEWTGLSYQERLVGHTLTLVFGLALLLVYLVLAGQYESWWLPVPVLLAVPLSLVGTLLALAISGLANNVYVQIGLVLLIALSAKNAILIVEVAQDLRRGGKPIVEAALEASRRRFRPILMTSFAFILGVVPLMLARGAGAAARQSIGVTVFSGMLASTLLAVALVPVFYVVVEGLRSGGGETAVNTEPDRAPESRIVETGAGPAKGE
jgi:hydrophobic/amphiphilic exporter-1 (mainly G- bacteria), HAE1 family